MGESNGKLPLKKLAQDAAYQSYTSRLTELWSLPKPAQGLNTYNNNNTKRGPGGTPSVFLIFYVFLKEHFISLIT